MENKLDGEEGHGVEDVTSRQISLEALPDDGGSDQRSSRRYKENNGL